MKVGIRARRTAAFAAASIGLAGCGGSGTNLFAPTDADVTTGVLKLSVGTANIYGDLGSAAAGARIGLNVVASYRRSGGADSGDDAVSMSSPLLTGPFTLPGVAGTGASFDQTSSILTGPGTSEIGTNAMRSFAPGTSGVLTTFGSSGGVFQIGVEPFNHQSGAPQATIEPYPVPLYDAATASARDVNQLPAAWGGPPAFNFVDTSGSSPSGLVPASEGLDVFSGVAPATGVYTLSLSVRTNSGAFTAKTSAGLSSTALLPAVAPPVATFDNAGGGTFTATLPAPITEAYLQIVDVGPAVEGPGGFQPIGCNGAGNGVSTLETGHGVAPPIYYTLAVSTAAPTGTLPDTTGSNGLPSLCTATQNLTTNGGFPAGPDVVLVQTYAFDYPLYENTQTRIAQRLTANPTFSGPGGRSDVSVSSLAEYNGLGFSSSRVRLRVMTRWFGHAQPIR